MSNRMDSEPNFKFGWLVRAFLVVEVMGFGSG